MSDGESAHRRIPPMRPGRDNRTILENLGLLAELAGTWQGTGFNLVARPDFQDGTNVFGSSTFQVEGVVLSKSSMGAPIR